MQPLVRCTLCSVYDTIYEEHNITIAHRSISSDRVRQIGRSRRPAVDTNSEQNGKAKKGNERTIDQQL